MEYCQRFVSSQVLRQVTHSRRSKKSNLTFAEACAEEGAIATGQPRQQRMAFFCGTWKLTACRPRPAEQRQNSGWT
jgi:hypothetical protein